MKKATMKTTMTNNDMGAPTQAELDNFQSAANMANMRVVRTKAAVAEAVEKLACCQADEAAALAATARINVEGMELQQRVNFAQQAAPAIVRAPAAAAAGMRR